MKTVRKEFGTSHELHPIVSAGGFAGALKSPSTAPGGTSESLRLNCIFFDKKARILSALLI